MSAPGNHILGNGLSDKVSFIIGENVDIYDIQGIRRGVSSILYSSTRVMAIIQMGDISKRVFSINSKICRCRVRV